MDNFFCGLMEVVSFGVEERTSRSPVFPNIGVAGNEPFDQKQSTQPLPSMSIKSKIELCCG